MLKSAKGRAKRKLRIRKKISGTAERPRLSVFRSGSHIYAQAIDDVAGVTLASASDLQKSVGAEGTKTDRAKSVGTAVANACKAKGIESVVFDRNGFIYHGRVKALAEAARAAGLNF